MKQIALLILAFLVKCHWALGQTNLPSNPTLKDCIDIALSNNLDVKQSELSTEASKIDFRQTQLNLLPTVNMNYNLGVNNGRSINPFTNTFIEEKLTFSNLGLNANMTIFNGFRLLNSIKRDRFNLQAAEMELEEAKQSLILDVTAAYIGILNSRDQIVLAEARRETTEKQLKRLKSQFEEGAGSPVDYTDMQGQLALDKVAIINAKNNYKAAVLNLVNLLNIGDNTKTLFQDVLDEVDIKAYEFSAETVYNEALLNLASFKARQLRIDAAVSGVKVAKSNFVPQVSLFGQLNTNYSSVAETFESTGSVIEETGDFVTINNQDFPVFQNKTQFEGKSIAYRDQFDNNLNTVVGVSVRVPIFNGFRARNSVGLQKVQLEQSKVNLNNTKLLFKQAIEQAHFDMVAAFERYRILTDQVEAYKESFRINEVRFNNGVSNIVNYITSKNNMDNAQLNLNMAKYEYVLRVKILDFYRGV